eukprot:jgi/Ulvmu1/1950/UM012_0111.1
MPPHTSPSGGFACSRMRPARSPVHVFNGTCRCQVPHTVYRLLHRAYMVASVAHESVAGMACLMVLPAHGLGSVIPTHRKSWQRISRGEHQTVFNIRVFGPKLVPIAPNCQI